MVSIAEVPKKHDRIPRSVIANSMERRDMMCQIKSMEEDVRIMSSTKSNKKLVETPLLNVKKDESDFL